MSILTVHKNNSIQKIQFDSKENLLELLRTNGFNINAPCGGNGKCGKCIVSLSQNGIQKNVHACDTYVDCDCTVLLPEENDNVSWENSDTSHCDAKNCNSIGAAVDLGTTTVAVKLFNLSDGKLLGTSSKWNNQKSYGSDVITRIDFCMKDESNLSTLSGIIRSQVKDMISSLCLQNGLSFDNLSEIVLAGNTVMQHIFVNISPASIASAPFKPLSLFDDDTKYDLDGVSLTLFPCIAGYVGGDITSGLLFTNLNKRKEKSLFIDVGTNGEMVLGDAKGLTACAVASGPAFEGAEISCGMPAIDGAIYEIKLSDEGLQYSVIGQGEAKGLCGSALLDLTACLLDLGYIDQTGRLIENENGKAEFYLTETVYLSQRDIRQLQLAKAAVAAGIRILMQKENLNYNHVDKLYLAGGFGNNLNVESAVRIGMIPKELKDKVVAVGNASLSGAEKLLLDPKFRQELADIKSNCRYIELSTNKDFNDTFTEEMNFPEDIL